MGKVAIVSKVGAFITKNKSTLLTSIELLGLGATAATTAKATVKAVRKADDILSEAKDPSSKETKTEVFKAVAPCYITPLTILILTGLSAVMREYIHIQDLAALMAGYKLVVGKNENLEEAIKKTVGEKKADEIFGVAADEEVRNNPVTNVTNIYGTGNLTFYDAVTKDYFTSDYEKVRQAADRINDRIKFQEETVTVNDFHDEIGEDAFPIVSEEDRESYKHWERYGWDWNYEQKLLEYSIKPKTEKDGRIVHILMYKPLPIGFNSY